ncbi:hypothetical protein ACFOSS_14055 [Pseudaeromonas sharmana]|uniref:Uncharacterized protein n=1 Tax=Pseudaeromonas sharmana TaxID=328412 RepID=A0ABV8CQU8_9GAMM
MIDDIYKSIKASMYERATSPLFGAFAISWSLWNYKTILVILSSMKVNDKISYIESEIYSEDWSLLLGGAIYPLISAVFFILIYPHPAKWIYKYWNNQQKKLKEIKQRIEDDTPLTLDESRQIRRELLRFESYYDDEITKKNNEIDRLKDIISTLEKQAQASSPEPAPEKSPSPKQQTKPKVDDRINEDQESILADIAKSGGWVTDDQFVSKSKFDTVKTEYYLEDLEAKGYVTRGYVGAKGGISTTLTTKGKKFAIDKGAVS